MSVQALVLAAGRGTRLATVSGLLPKPLIRVGSHSLLEWNLLWLRDHGITQVWVNLHHEAARIRAAIGTGTHLGVYVRYSYERELLGTAGAWKALEPEWQSTSLVIYGDNLMRFDLGRLLAGHSAGAAAATVALFDPDRHANTGGAGGCARVGENDRVVSFVEGWPAEGLVNAGVYALEPGVAGVIGSGARDFGHDVLPVLAAGGELRAHVLEPDGFCLGADTPERLAEARRLVGSAGVRP